MYVCLVLVFKLRGSRVAGAEVSRTGRFRGRSLPWAVMDASSVDATVRGKLLFPKWVLIPQRAVSTRHEFRLVVRKGVRPTFV